MGFLKNFNLNELKNEYQIEVFVETGTYMGASLEYAIKSNFKDLYSIEILDSYYKKCVEKFKNNTNVHLYHGSSVDGLKKISEDIKEKNVLFWLDAHLPDFYDSSYNEDYLNNEEIYIPLKKEISVIKNNKNISNDVFIIDDLRIYENGNYKSGNWDGLLKNKNYTEGISFVYDLLKETHNIEKDYNDEGYLICKPKK